MADGYYGTQMAGAALQGFMKSYNRSLNMQANIKRYDLQERRYADQVARQDRNFALQQERYDIADERYEAGVRAATGKRMYQIGQDVQKRSDAMYDEMSEIDQLESNYPGRDFSARRANVRAKYHGVSQIGQPRGVVPTRQPFGPSSITIGRSPQAEPAGTEYSGSPEIGDTVEHYGQYYQYFGDDNYMATKINKDNVRVTTGGFIDLPQPGVKIKPKLGTPDGDELRTKTKGFALEGLADIDIEGMGYFTDTIGENGSPAGVRVPLKQSWQELGNKLATEYGVQGGEGESKGWNALPGEYREIGRTIMEEKISDLDISGDKKKLMISEFDAIGKERQINLGEEDKRILSRPAREIEEPMTSAINRILFKPLSKAVWEGGMNILPGKPGSRLARAISSKKYDKDDVKAGVEEAQTTMNEKYPSIDDKRKLLGNARDGALNDIPDEDVQEMFDDTIREQVILRLHPTTKGMYHTAPYNRGIGAIGMGATAIDKTAQGILNIGGAVVDKAKKAGSIMQYGTKKESGYTMPGRRQPQQTTTNRFDMHMREY